MKVEFAPLNIPLARRLQTAAVLQWVLSFLLLGKDPRALPGAKIQASLFGAGGLRLLPRRQSLSKDALRSAFFPCKSEQEGQRGLWRANLGLLVFLPTCTS